jgi:hypothetical protein
MTLLGKFPKSKLAIVAASLLSVAVISGVFAVPGPPPASEPAAATTSESAPAEPAPQPQPQPQRIIRRVYVIRRAPSGSVEIAPLDVAVPQEPAAAPPPAQPAPAPAVKPAAKPAPQPVARSRGS